MSEETNKLTYNTVKEKYIEAVRIVNLQKDDEVESAYAQGAAEAWEEVLTLMGREVKRSLFIDENGTQMIPYIVIDGVRTNIKSLFSEETEKSEETVVQSVSDKENEKPKRKTRRNKKTSYLKLYNETFPDREVDISTKYDKIMDSVLSKFDRNERTFIIKRFGLDGDGTRSYRQIAEEAGNISRSTVTKIIDRILDTIRESENAEILEEAFVSLDMPKETEKIITEEIIEPPVSRTDTFEVDIEDSDFLPGENLTGEEDSDNDPDFLDDPPDDLDEESDDNNETPFNFPF